MQTRTSDSLKKNSKQSLLFLFGLIIYLYIYENAYENFVSTCTGCRESVEKNTCFSALNSIFKNLSFY